MFINNNLQTMTKFLKLLFSTLMISFCFFFTSCNKDVQQLELPDEPIQYGSLLNDMIKSNPDYSLYYSLIIKGGQLSLISDSTRSYTMFVPNNQAMKRFINIQSGGLIPIASPEFLFSTFISTAITNEQAAALVQYNTMPQSIYTKDFSSGFPNFFYPTAFNPAPSISELLRLISYPSSMNGFWLNNIRITSTDNHAYNGVIHQTELLETPPQRFLWDRINTDTNLVYLKKAIIRADSGTASPGFIQGVLQNIGANLTVFAPTNQAFKKSITPLLVQNLLDQGDSLSHAIQTAAIWVENPDSIFNNPVLYEVLNTQSIGAILAYHVLDTGAVFTNNFYTTNTYYHTFLNRYFPTHPGLQIKVNFGNPYVTSATIKGLANSSTVDVLINSTSLQSDPNGTSDQLYLNGVMHKINGVLFPL